MRLIGSLLAGALALALVFSAEAKPTKANPNNPTPSIALVESSVSLGDTVHFTYVLPKGVKPTCGFAQFGCARVLVECTQEVPFDYSDGNGDTFTHTDPLVYGEAMHATTAADGFVLGGAASVWLWHGGSASCVASLFSWETQKGDVVQVTHAQVAFEAGG